jgi:hypothetical protein
VVNSSAGLAGLLQSQTPCTHVEITVQRSIRQHQVMGALGEKPANLA